MFDKLSNSIKSTREKNGTLYLILLAFSCIAVPLKLLLFYIMMDITANRAAVWLITLALVYLLFASFRNKWIPAALFLVFSFLMFADAAYSSFFNRYLSVNMLGAAGLLGGVQESVKEVLKAKYLLLFVDSVAIFGALIAARLHRNGKFPEKKATTEAPHLAGGREESISGKMTHPFIALLILFTLMAGASINCTIASAANQEFFSFHIRDVFKKAIASEEELYVDPSDLIIATGTYENEKDGPLFGIAKGRNLIVIQVESFQNMVVGATYNGHAITPNLNKLIRGDSIYFDNYYEQRGSGNTSDAEYATNNGLYGTITSYTYGLYSNNYFRGLPWQLKEAGYSTAAFHGYEKDFWSRDAAYPGQGFDRFYSELDFDASEIIGMGISDVEFFEQSTDYMLTMKQPFYGFCVTLSNHYPFQLPEKYQTIPLLPEDEGTIFGNYVNSARYTDEAIGLLIGMLKEKGLYDNSVIAIYGDHFGLTPNEPEIYESVSRFLGKAYDYDNMMNIPCIIHVPGSGLSETVSISGGHMDFMPTAAYLFGLEELDTLYFGHNLLTVNEGFVAEQAYMPKGSFIKDDIIFEMSRDGVFDNSRAWNIRTGETVPVSECRDGYLKSKLIIDSCEYYLKNDILRKVLLEQATTEELFENHRILDAPERIVLAGGGDSRLAGTNSLEALDTSYAAGDRYLKILMEWTDEGVSFMRAKDGYTSLDFESLASWLENHEDAFLVIEMDRDIPYLLDGVRKKFPDIRKQIIPEIASMEDYSRALYLGFGSSLFAMRDEYGYTREQIIDFVELNAVWAVCTTADAMDKAYEELAAKGRTFYLQSDPFYEKVER